MASRGHDRALELFAFTHCLEVVTLKLSAEHFPISCSLRPQLEGAINKNGRKPDDDIMSLEELLAYVRNPSDLDLSPYADLLAQTEAMGDPAVASWEHTVILRWFGEAWHLYEQRFPLEEPLASSVRRLKPLAASFALSDPDFMQPDVHPLHQLLDCIQERAVGWQVSLGRVGANLEKQISRAVNDALGWFESDRIEIGDVCAEFLEAAERDLSRARRMSQRVIDTEMGRLKTANAKTTAALMINAALGKSDAPQPIGQFLKGPWYDSAQLVLLKHGEDSDEWSKMSKATELLLESVQSMEGASEDRRQRIFALVSKLPKEIRRWLLSLHHDTGAVNEAMHSVEGVHLKILRGEEPERTSHGPIPVAVAGEAAADPKYSEALKPIREWQWFSIKSFKGSTVRVQLVLKNETSQRLVFANMAGIRVADFSFEEFDELILKKRIIAMPAGGGFSLCLALAAGIDTTEKLDALYASVAGPEADATRLKPTKPDAVKTSPEPPDSPVASGANEPVATQVSRATDDLMDEDLVLHEFSDVQREEVLTPEELEGLESLIGDEELPPRSAKTEPRIEEVTDEGEDAEEDVITDAPDDEAGHPDEESGFLSDFNTPETPPDTQTGNYFPVSGPDESPSTADSESLFRLEELDELESLSTGETANNERTDTERKTESASGNYFGASQESDGIESGATPSGGGRAESSRAEGSGAEGSGADINHSGRATAGDSFAETTSPGTFSGYLSGATTPESKPAPSAGKVDLPMGTWLGFHDGDMPMMARLAVHDPGNDQYIFVNRKGIKLREVDGATLAELFDEGLVEVLQTSSPTRDR